MKIIPHAHEIEDLAAINNGMYPTDMVTSGEMKDLSGYEKFTMPKGDTVTPIKGKMIQLYNDNRLIMPSDRCYIEARGSGGACSVVITQNYPKNINLVFAYRRQKYDWVMAAEQMTYSKETGLVLAAVVKGDRLKGYLWGRRTEGPTLIPQETIALARHTLGNFLLAWADPKTQKIETKPPEKLNAARVKAGKTEITPFTIINQGNNDDK